MTSRILLRRGTADQWSSVNPILSTGELGIETDTLKIKIGNGTSTWNQLTSYANVTPSQLTSEINNLINAAPATLDTLNELAAAINNDASFSTTVNNLLTGKVSKSGGDTITASTASTVGLIIKGVASQTANLQEWYNSSNVLISWVRRDGLLAGQIQSPTIFQALVQPNSASGIPLTVKGFASQTANLQEWQNSSGTVGMAVNSATQLVVNSVAYFNANIYMSASTEYNAKLNVITRSTSESGITIRGRASQTGNLQEWQDSAGTVLASVIAGGSIRGFAGLYGANSANSSVNPLFVVNSVAANVVAVIKGAASQTANLQEWQNSDGTVVTRVSSDARIFSTQTITAGNANDAPAALNAFPQSASLVGLVVKGLASQTGDLQQWQNNSGTVLSKVTASGSYLTSARISAGSTSVATGNINSYISSPSLVGILVQGAASQTANLQEWQDSSGTVLSSITYFGGARLYDLGIKGSPAGIGWAYFGNDNTSTKNIVVRAFASQTANLQEWQDSAGTVLVSVLSNGRTTIRSNGADYGAALSVGTNSTTAVGLVVRGVTSQTANLQEWQNSTGSVVSSISNAGLATFSNVGVTNNINAYYGKISANTQALGYLGQLSAITANASTIGLVVRGAASQTANLQEWQNSSGTVLARIDANGQGALKSTTLTASSSGGSALTLVAASGQTAPLLIAPGGTQINSSGNYLITPGLTVNYVSDFHAGASNITPIYIKGAASQSADLTQWANNAGTVLTKITSDGKVIAYGDDLGNFQSIGLSSTLYNGFTTTTNNNSGSYTLGTAGASETTFNVPNAFYIYDRINGAMRFKIMSTGLVGINSFNPDAQLQVNSSSASTVGAIIKGSDSQTANLQEWQDSTGAVKMSVNKFGSIVASAGGTYISTFGDALFGARNATTIPLTVKGAASQTANLQEWQSSNGTVQSRMTDIGKLFSNYLQSSYGILTGNATYAGGYNFISNPSFATTDVSLIVKAVTSQTTDLQQWQNSAGTVLVKIAVDGTTTFSGGYTSINQYGEILTTGSRPLGIGGTLFTNTVVSIQPTLASLVGIAVRGAASQTANLQEWQDSAGNVLASLSINTVGSNNAVLKLQGTYGGIASNGEWSILREGGDLNFYAPSNYLIRSVYGGVVKIRGHASQTANLTEWQNSSGTVLASVAADGATTISGASGVGSLLVGTNGNSSLRTAGLVGLGTQYVDGSYQVQIFTTTASRIGVMVRGTASQTGDLTQWQNSAGTVLAKVTSDGSIITPGLSVQYGIYSTTAGKASINPNYDTGSMGIYTENATNKGLVVRGAASQTADLQQWQNSAGTVLAEITASGSLELNGKDIELMNIMGAF